MEKEKIDAVTFAESFVRSRAVLPYLQRRVPLWYHPEHNLDVEYKRVFYIGDFIRTHFSGRALGDNDNESIRMHDALPHWAEKKAKTTDSEENKAVIYSITLELIEKATKRAAQLYLDALQKPSGEADSFYQDQYNYWSCVNQIAKGAVEYRERVLSYNKL